MFCNNCGNPLLSTDKFCSNCGTPVETVEKPEDPLFQDETMGTLQSEDGEVKVEPPTEKFDWNVHTFPGMEPHPTEEVNFDWHMDDGGTGKEQKGDEIAFAPEPGETKTEKRDTESFVTPVFKSKVTVDREEPAMEEVPAPPVEPEQPEGSRKEEAPSVEPEQLAESIKTPKPPLEERKAGSGAPVFVGVGPKLGTTEERKAGAGAPAFIGVGPKLGVIESEKTILPEKKEEPVPETPKEVEATPVQEAPPARTFDPEVPKQDKVVGPKMWTPEPPAPEAAGGKEEILEGEALEREIFENVETAVNPTLARQTAKIDKFYTFNKKNEEFQKLLDKEYEKFKGGQGEKADTFGSDVESLRRDADAPEDGFPVIHADSQVEEMAKARELFFADDVEAEDLEGMGEEAKAPEPTPAPKAEEKTETVDRTSAAEEVPPAEKVKVPEEDSKEADMVPVVEAEDGVVSDEEPVKKKSGKAGTVVIVVLSIILAVLIVLLAIRFFAPDSPAAKKMDKITDNLFSVFTGSEDTATAVDQPDANTPKEDKTGLIQLELGKNQDGIIETIRYNGSLAFDETVDYGDKDINGSQKLTDNKWYTDAKKKEHYLDQGIVGTIIAHVSRSAVENKGTNPLTTLDIGEFRKGEKGYYVWVAEYGNTSDQGETVAKKIYLVTVDGENMNVTESYNL